jgi:glyoxylase-like metal-dependent hydrolase (beta-lactamase superfamily II)
MIGDEAADGVWRITTPLPFRPREVHAYLVRLETGKFLLVDGGIGTPDAWTALESGVGAVAGAWSEVSHQVITHMHLDHLGLARRTRDASQARVLMSRLDGERSRHADLHPDEEADYREALLRQNGAPQDVIRAVQASRAQAAGLATFVEPDEVLDGEAGDLPGCAGWRWIWTPGHTAGHLSLFRPTDRVLIAGDAVLPRITPTIGVNRQSADPVGDYLAALERLAALEPARVLAGHGAPIAEPMERVRELQQATREESERILGCLQQKPATVWQIAQCRHPASDLPPATRMLAFREALAHLDHLVATRRASRTEDGELWRYSIHS